MRFAIRRRRRGVRKVDSDGADWTLCRTHYGRLDLTYAILQARAAYGGEQVDRTWKRNAASFVVQYDIYHDKLLFLRKRGGIFLTKSLQSEKHGIKHGLREDRGDVIGWLQSFSSVSQVFLLSGE